ncbi:hypothetical protein VZ95_03005 [Elstera litoralis]|uniref:Uncharacterized protein n=1 Tax=Elstera litoralis TaxID=552518 RepID=A0A0F3IW10_9PROT|nr:hypothetical protein [Elstera litoralis]KJV10728.1 hypothetical protein VZ95_03005 [Elstera litoralis]
MPVTRDPVTPLYDLPIPWTERLQTRLDRRPWLGAALLYALPVGLMLLARLLLVPTLSEAEAARLLQMRAWVWFYGPEVSPLPLWLGHGLLRLNWPRLAVLLPDAVTLWGVLLTGYAVARLWLSRAQARFAGASLLLLTPLGLAFPSGEPLALFACWAILALVGASVRTLRRGGWGNGALLAASLAFCLTGGRGALLFALVFLLSLAIDRDLRVTRQRYRIPLALGLVAGLLGALPYLVAGLTDLRASPLLLLFPPPEMIEAFPRALLHGWSVLAERAAMDLLFWIGAALLMAPALLRPSRAVDLWPGVIAQSCVATLILLAGATVLERGPIITDSGPLACLVLVPLLIFIALDRLPLAAWRRLAVGVLIGAVALLGPLTLLIEDRLLLPTCATCRTDADFKSFTRQLAESGRGPFLVPDPWLAGNLALHRPDLIAAPGKSACTLLTMDATPAPPLGSTLGPATALLLPRLRYTGAPLPVTLAPIQRGACP